MATQIQHLDEQGFDQFIANGTVLVDFWATWCGPCRAQGKILEQLAAREDFQGTIGKLDVDEARDIAARYGIMSIPTIIVFKDGQGARQMVGLQDEDTLIDALK